MSITRRNLTLALPALLLPFAQPRAQARNGTLTVYNAQHANLTKAWTDGFTSDTGLKVSLRTATIPSWATCWCRRVPPPRPMCFLTENSPAMALVQNAGLFAPVDPATSALIDPSFVPAGGKWVGIAARSTALCYDTRKLTEAQLPASIMDLADPAWKGRWAAAPAGADFQAIVSAMLLLKGHDATLAWLRDMKQNVQTYRSNSLAMKAVNAGEVPCAIIYHYYYMGDAARTGEKQRPRQAALLPPPGPWCIRQHLRRRRAPVRQAAERFTGAARLDRRSEGPGHPAYRRLLRICRRQERGIQPRLVPLAELQAPTVDPDKLNSRAVSDLMTQAGLI